MKRHRGLSRVLIAFLCAVGSLAAADDTTASSGAEAPAKGSVDRKIEELKEQIEAQQKQLDSMRVALEQQKRLLDAIRPKPFSLGEVATTTPIIPQGLETATAVPGALRPAVQQRAQQLPPNVTEQSKSALPTSPLQIQLGDAIFTPIGFMDFTNTFRSTNSGASLATNFGNIPYNNTVGGRLTENKMSIQNSRLGFRVDTMVHDWHILGYFESDFVGGIGNAAFNTQVSSNSVILRDRLYWVQLRKGPIEVLAGQSWSMMTPNRNHISPLPGDLFYGQEFDVNYLNGLTWGRMPGIRFVYHGGEKVTAGISLENSTQYFGGSGGGGVPTLPAALTSLGTSELDDNLVNGITLPNVHPDIIAKIAFDPSRRGHLEIAGVESTFRLFNPITQKYFTKAGGGGSINANLEIAKNVRLFTNNFWSAGGGRWMFGLAPNFIVRADGSISLVNSGSTVDGVEATVGNSLFFAYYGGVHIRRNVARDLNGSFIGYGYPGSPNSQNRNIQEGTFGLVQSIWKDAKFGAVTIYLQYAYFFRNPWYVASGAPKNAHQNAVWFDLRYTLPGGPPAIKY